MNLVQAPSDAAVEALQQAGGQLPEADLVSFLTVRRDANFARRAVSFAILRGAVTRTQHGTVTYLQTADGRAL